MLHEHREGKNLRTRSPGLASPHVFIKVSTLEKPICWSLDPPNLFAKRLSDRVYDFSVAAVATTSPTLYAKHVCKQVTLIST